MKEILRRDPAVGLTLAYAAASIVGVLMLGPPSDGSASLLVAVAAFITFITAVVIRGEHAPAILVTVIGLTGWLAIVPIPTLWRGLVVLVVPCAVVHVVFDRGNHEVEA